MWAVLNFLAFSFLSHHWNESIVVKRVHSKQSLFEFKLSGITVPSNAFVSFDISCCVRTKVFPKPKVEAVLPSVHLTYNLFMHFHIFPWRFICYFSLFDHFLIEHSLCFLCLFGGAKITTIITIKIVIGVFALFLELLLCGRTVRILPYYCRRLKAGH